MTKTVTYTCTSPVRKGTVGTQPRPSHNGPVRIGELAAQSGVSVRALRYYEEQGLLSPQRTSSGQRLYSSKDSLSVARIQELFAAGFCSTVIRELLPALLGDQRDIDTMRVAFDAARHRLESEKQAVEAELSELQRLRERLGLAPDAHVRVHDLEHDPHAPAPTAAPDHRDRRFR